MNGKTFSLRLYTVFLLIIFIAVMIPDFFSGECFSNWKEIVRIIVLSLFGITGLILFYIFPKKWGIIVLMHIIFALALTIFTQFPTKYLIAALLYTVAVVIAFVHDFYKVRSIVKYTISVAGLFILPLFEPGISVRVLIRSELVNAYILGIELFSLYLMRLYFLDYIVSEKQVLLSKKQVLDLKSLNLDERDTGFITLLLKGFTYKEIAEVYKLSESWVKKHVTTLYPKFGVTTKESFLTYISQFDIAFPPEDSRTQS